MPNRLAASIALFLALAASTARSLDCNGSTPAPGPETAVRMLADTATERARCQSLGGRIGTRDDFCSVQAPDYSASHWGCSDGDPVILVCMVPVTDAGQPTR
jgi:hypothetical protein